MPRLSREGNIGMGIGGHQGSVNSNLIPNSFGVYWKTNNVIVFGAPTGGLATYDLWTGERLAVNVHGANDLRAGGDVWAAWLDHYGLFSSTGFFNPDAGLMDVGPDGAIGFVPVRQAGVGIHVREVTEEIWQLTTGIVAELQLLGNRRAIWRDFNYQINVHNVPPCIQVSGCYFPHAVDMNGEWWIMYFSPEYGLVLHPFNSTIGYIIQGPTLNAFNPDAVKFQNNTIRVAWSTTAGEGPNDYRFIDINIATQPRVQIVQPVEIPVIGKPCWVGWFEFVNPISSNPPGNALLWVRQGATINRYNGSQFANWISGSSVEEIERLAAASSYPVVAYWDSRHWPSWPKLRDGDWISQFAYCPVGESPSQFEANMRSILDSYPPSYKQITLNCQCYTSNLSLTNNLKGLVPVYARLARDYPRVNMLLVFSDQGRATGLNDHPELRPDWSRLFEGVTGEPSMDNGIVDGVLVDPEKYWFWLTANENANDWQNVLNRLGPELYKYGLGQQKNSGGVPRGRLFLPWSQCPNAAPRNPAEEFLGVNQDAPCCGIGDVPCKKVDVVDDQNPRWIWIDRDSGIPYQPIPAPDQPGTIGILLYEYTNPVRRSDVTGLLIKFEVAADNPVVEIRFEINDGDQPFIWKWISGKDGRYFRAIAWKATVNGNWTAKITGIDNKGGVAVKEFPITVTF